MVEGAQGSCRLKYRDNARWKQNGFKASASVQAESAAEFSSIEGENTRDEINRGD